MAEQIRLDRFYLAGYFLAILWFSGVLSEGVTPVLVNTNQALDIIKFGRHLVFVLIRLSLNLFEDLSKTLYIYSLHELKQFNFVNHIFGY